MCCSSSIRASRYRQQEKSELTTAYSAMHTLEESPETADTRATFGNLHSPDLVREKKKLNNIYTQLVHTRHVYILVTIFS